MHIYFYMVLGIAYNDAHHGRSFKPHLCLMFSCKISELFVFDLPQHVSVCAGAGLTTAPTKQCSSFQCARPWC